MYSQFSMKILLFLAFLFTTVVMCKPDNSNTAQITRCQEHKLKLETSLDSLQLIYKNLELEKVGKEEDVQHSQQEIISLKTLQIQLDNEIKQIGEKKNIAESDKQKVEKKKCYWTDGQSCIDEREASINKLKEELSQMSDQLTAHQIEKETLERVKLPEWIEKSEKLKTELNLMSDKLNELIIEISKVKSAIPVDCI